MVILWERFNKTQRAFPRNKEKHGYINMELLNCFCRRLQVILPARSAMKDDYHANKLMEDKITALRVTQKVSPYRDALLVFFKGQYYWSGFHRKLSGGFIHVRDNNPIPLPWKTCKKSCLFTLTLSTRDPLVVDTGLALVKSSSIFSIRLPWMTWKKSLVPTINQES